MKRPTWKGHISFGLVNIPVTLYSAEQRADLQFHMLDSRDHARVRYTRVNEVTGEEVPWNDIVKGFEYDESNYVVLEDEDFKRAAAEATKSVEIEGFVSRGEINYVYFERPYYLVPGPKGEKGYVLLRETLKKADKVGIARVVIRTREYLAALIAEGDALVLDLLRFHQEVVSADTFELPRGSLKDYKITPREIEMATQLVESMTAPWQPEQFHDEFRASLMKWIERKIKSDDTARGPHVEEEPEGTSTAEVIDIMDLLRRSVKQKTQRKSKPRKDRANHKNGATGRRKTRTG